jgi:uncharacterized protein YndB with AHSA1/START domain
VIPASPESVYNALIDPDALTVWLPPAGMSGRFEQFDARPGGSYRLVLTYTSETSAAGKSTLDTDVVDARFLELVPGVRVTQAVDFVSDDPAYAGTMVITWAFSPTDGGTHVEVRADNVPVGISADDHAAGLASSLTNLAAYLDA